MKVEQVEPKPVFKPIMITLESQEEVDKLMGILNHAGLIYHLEITSWFDSLRPYSEPVNFNVHWIKIANLIER